MNVLNTAELCAVKRSILPSVNFTLIEVKVSLPAHLRSPTLSDLDLLHPHRPSLPSSLTGLPAPP